MSPTDRGRPPEVLSTDSRSSDLSAQHFVAALVGAPRVVGAFALAGLVIGLLAALLTTSKYRAEASFLAEPSEGISPSVAGLAGQFGLRLPTSGGAPGPEFYESVMRTRSVVEPLLLRPRRGFGDADTPRALLDELDLSGETQPERLHAALAWYENEALGTSIGRETGIVRFSITTRWPEVSHGLALDLLDGLRTFDVQYRQSRAQAERIFLQQRVDSASSELEEAERRLLTFLQQNRQFEGSPELRFEHDRLQRVVTARQAVYTGLLEAFEQARVREVRNTPIVTVIDPPAMPAIAEPRGRLLKLVIGLMFGVAVGWGIAVVRYAFSDNDPGEWLTSLRGDSARTVHHERRDRRISG